MLLNISVKCAIPFHVMLSLLFIEKLEQNPLFATDTRRHFLIPTDIHRLTLIQHTHTHTQYNNRFMRKD